MVANATVVATYTVLNVAPSPSPPTLADSDPAEADGAIGTMERSEFAMLPPAVCDDGATDTVKVLVKLLGRAGDAAGKVSVSRVVGTDEVEVDTWVDVIRTVTSPSSLSELLADLNEDVTNGVGVDVEESGGTSIVIVLLGLSELLGKLLGIVVCTASALADRVIEVVDGLVVELGTLDNALCLPLAPTDLDVDCVNVVVEKAVLVSP